MAMEKNLQTSSQRHSQTKRVHTSSSLLGQERILFLLHIIWYLMMKLLVVWQISMAHHTHLLVFQTHFLLHEMFLKMMHLHLLMHITVRRTTNLQVLLHTLELSQIEHTLLTTTLKQQQNSLINLLTKQVRKRLAQIHLMQMLVKPIGKMLRQNSRLLWLTTNKRWLTLLLLKHSKMHLLERKLIQIKLLMMQRVLQSQTQMLSKNLKKVRHLQSQQLLTLKALEHTRKVR